MFIILLIFLSIVAELLIYYIKSADKLKVLLSASSLWFIGMSLGAVFASQGWVVVSAYTFLSVIRATNILRINRPNVNKRYYEAVGKTTGIYIIFSAVVLAPLVIVLNNIDTNSMLLIIASFQLIMSTLILAVTTHNLHKTLYTATRKNYSDSELPSVTIAIPARNETPDLASCLTSALASDYPKLEVIVLDDCSQDSTPQVVKEFAHEGVRFLKGVQPKNGWLAKNQAYQQLLEEASGELIVFCGVDIRFDNDSIKQIVSSLLTKKRDMISFLPSRQGGGMQTSIVQPMRYWWELALPRRPFNRPPVLSSCWCVKKSSLKKLGGFSAVSNSISPEGYFARELIRDDKYAFLQAKSLRIRSTKSAEAQLETALRMRYPEFRKRLEIAAFVLILEAIVLAGPFVLIATSLWTSVSAYHGLSMLAVITLLVTNYKIVVATTEKATFVSVFNFPVVVFVELVISIISVFRYDFSHVTWKGRNICEPMMRVLPHLPKIPKKNAQSA